MIPRFECLLLPGRTGIFEITYEFLLLRIDADYRFTIADKGISHSLYAFELPISILRRSGGTFLVINAETKVNVLEEFANRIFADLNF